MNTINNKTLSIFITGNSRSGTTMLAKILGKNSLIFMFYELHFFEQLWYPQKNIKKITREEGINLFSELISLQREGFLAERNPKQFCAEATAFFDLNATNAITAPDVFINFLLYESALHNKVIPCEQTPRNLFFIDEISELYPSAKIICMIRDPRDVLLSQKYKWKRRLYGHPDLPVKEMVRAWFNYHAITISKLWSSAAEKILSSVNKPNVYLIKFEELLEQPEIVINRLCNFLNVGFNASMLSIPTEGSSIVNDESGKFGIDKSRAGNFLKGGLTKTEIYICDKITSGLRKKFGYKDVNIKPNIFLLLIEYISFPIKIFFALLLNLKRSKNLISSIKRRLNLKTD
jgi:hypothetical protein